MKMNDLSPQEAMRLAQTDSGQNLISALQKSQNPDLHDALRYASEGDMEKTKRAVSGLLNDPNIRDLIAQLGNSHG